jgi:IS5 family transposase
VARDWWLVKDDDLDPLCWKGSRSPCFVPKAISRRCGSPCFRRGCCGFRRSWHGWTLLDDPAFFDPFAPYFHPVIGRPSTPVECYLRLMFLKFLYRLGYESLCAEVSGSISWRRFCQIPMDGRVPHPTTLMKLTTRCGETPAEGLNEALPARAAGQKLLRAGRVRAGTTVIPANVACPTDSGLLARAVGKLARTVGRVQAAGGAAGTNVVDRRRAAARRVGKSHAGCAPGGSFPVRKAPG